LTRADSTLIVNSSAFREGDGRPAPTHPPPHLILGKKRVGEGRKPGGGRKKKKKESPPPLAQSLDIAPCPPPFSSRSASATAVN